MEQLHEFMDNLADGWLAVGMVILALMVGLSMRDEWQAENGNRVEVVGMGLLIAAGIYVVGFR